MRSVPRVLVCDDERPLRLALDRFLRSLGLDAVAVESAEGALRELDACDLIISDVRMPGMDGLQLLAEVRRRRPELPFILLTGHGTVTMAVQAMRMGAANFLSKPFDLDELQQVVTSTLEAAASPGSLTPGPRTATTSSDALVGESPSMRSLRDLTARVASSDATVLIMGESGSGKEVVARAVHAQSRRARGPFVAVNCGAIPEALLESELFGHIKGAFTGAIQTRVGRLGQAEGGTMLLDEIGELPLAMQVKLLRVLQERAYTPVGDTEARPADVRIVAATHRNLESMVEARTFREDLYYRLNVLPIVVPALRERGDDVLHLARKFLSRAAAAEARSAMTFEDHVAVCLTRYSWPGNVRELEHAITRATVLAVGTMVTLADLPPRVRAAFGQGDDAAAPATPVSPAPVALPQGTPPTGLPRLPEGGVNLKSTLDRLERDMIERALAQTRGNKNRAAALLGLNRTTLVEKLKRM